MPKAVIIGSKGQDGSYLLEFLQSKAYDLISVTRSGVDGRLSNRYPSLALTSSDFGTLLSAEQPDEIYYLAAFHHSAEDCLIDDLQLLHKSFETNTSGLMEVLHSISRCSPKSRLFYAASSHVFGRPSSAVQDETTPMNPVNAYGISKTAGVHLCRYFRAQHNLYASVGILYNHESPRRSARFLSKKVVQAAVRIKRGEQDRLVLGHLNAFVDWGYAGDYVRAMWGILQLDEPDEFVVATGILRSIRDFVEKAFALLDLDYSKYVAERADILTKVPITLCGDSSKLRRLAQWQPESTFENLIQMMIRAELESGC